MYDLFYSVAVLGACILGFIVMAHTAIMLDSTTSGGEAKKDIEQCLDSIQRMNSCCKEEVNFLCCKHEWQMLLLFLRAHPQHVKLFEKRNMTDEVVNAVKFKWLRPKEDWLHARIVKAAQVEAGPSSV